MEQSLRSNSFREKLLFPLLHSYSNVPLLTSFLLSFSHYRICFDREFALSFTLPRHVRFSLSIPWPGRSVKPRTRIVSSSIARLMKCERRYNVSPTFLASSRFLFLSLFRLRFSSILLFVFLLSNFRYRFRIRLVNFQIRSWNDFEIRFDNPLNPLNTISLAIKRDR